VRSSTSSFKHIIVKSAVFCLVSFVLYTALIIITKPRVTVMLNQWQGNMVAAQDYIYDNPDRPVVIVGSSLAAKLDMEYLGPDYWNLAFAGGSVSTGLEIIARSGARPKIICVEANIFRDTDEKMIKDLFTPIVWEWKKHIPSLRLKYQPFTIAYNLVNRLFKTRSRLENEYQVDPAFFQKMLDSYRRDYAKAPDEREVSRRIGVIRGQVERLSARNARFFFFETPIHPGLADSVQSTCVRKRLMEAFPPGSYTWLPRPDDAKYRTTDGIHLTDSSACEFARVFQEMVGKAIGKNGIRE